ncbi:MAG: hypothetical protein QMC56_01460 [Nitrosopumilus sp.]|jgi:hypothetical protein
MFGCVDKTKTKHRQFVDSIRIDKLIEIKIKECERENDICMISTSNRLQKKYGNEHVNRVVSRLSQRSI